MQSSGALRGQLILETFERLDKRTAAWISAKSFLCNPAPVSLTHTVARSLDKNIQADLIYLDFAKAFDTVDHSVLLTKVRLYGVKCQLFCWFKDYQTERKQRVVLEGAASHWSPVTSGVPQAPSCSLSS